MDRQRPPRSPVTSETTWLIEDFAELFRRILEKATTGIIVDGHVPAEAIRGIIGAGNGGTGNGSGTTPPTPGSVDNESVGDSANVDPGKLDQALLATLLYEYLKLHVLPGTNISITLDEITQSLTLSATQQPDQIAVPLTNGDPDFPELIFEDGDVLMELVNV